MIINGSQNARTRLILAHGSGSDMESPFMQTMSNKIAEKVDLADGFSVVRFNFPYIDSIKKSGKRRPPDGAEKLIENYKQMIKHQFESGAEVLFIGGKSMGGRIASMICNDEPLVKGLICLGYPFHPPGKPEKLRTEHLYELHSPALICQGERDIFGYKDEVKSYDLPKNIHISWMKDGDHSFVPRKKSGFTESENLQQASTDISRFILEQSSIHKNLKA